MINLYSNVAVFAEQYDCFVLDLWGVIHDGQVLYPDAMECLAQLKKHNKIVILLSNSSMSSAQLVADLDRFGVQAQYYDAAVTAGEVTCDVLRYSRESWAGSLGKKYYYIGPYERSELLINLGIGYMPVTSLQEADFVLVTGTLPALSQPQDYYALGTQIAALNLPILCPNPDISIVQMDGTIHTCAGGIAKFCETKCGCQVYYVGKPDPLIYKYSFNLVAAKLAHTSKSPRIMAIGDTLETDVQGAINSDIHACLTASGLTAFRLFHKLNIDAALHSRLAAHCLAVGIVPQIIIPRLVW